jgi:hypothetical protein
MAFIFTPERDPRRENVAAFKAGDKVKYRNMTMPAEILSGPHQSPGAARYLIRKADGNVSLAPVTYLERIVPRLDQVAGTLAMVLYGRSFVSLPPHTRLQVVQGASRAIAIADNTKGQA